MAERYWVPVSLPWRFRVVGSWTLKKMVRRSVVRRGCTGIGEELGGEVDLADLDVVGRAGADVLVTGVGLGAAWRVR